MTMVRVYLDGYEIYMTEAAMTEKLRAGRAEQGAGRRGGAEGDARGSHHSSLLGRVVRRRDDPTFTLGVIAALVLQSPCRALVLWGDEYSTFEGLDMLIEVVQRLL
jgi:hypothetical protein